MKKSSLVLACLMLSVSCSKVKEMDDRTKNMDKNTEKVSATTVQMKEITDEMKTITDQMRDVTGTMYQQIRSKEAEETRDRKFEILLDDKAGMGERITAAGVFYKSLEFQLYTDNGSFDDKHNQDALFLDAANEFTRRLCDLYDRIDVKDLNPTKKGKRHSDEMSFYSLAAALHMNHHFQDSVAERRHKSTHSMYDMITKALKKDFDKKLLEEHEEVLMNGINREIMIELLKARVDIISALALRNLTEQRDMTLTQKGKGLLFKITGGRFGAIDLPEVYDLMNDATKNTTETYLEAALKTKNFLAEIGVEKKLEKTISSALSRIDFNEVTGAQEEEEVDLKKEAIRSSIQGLLK